VGHLDLDRKKDAAWSRLSHAERSEIEAQDIQEVWFLTRVPTRGLAMR
jgi:hypothetical protein